MLGSLRISADRPMAIIDRCPGENEVHGVARTPTVYRRGLCSEVCLWCACARWMLCSAYMVSHDCEAQERRTVPLECLLLEWLGHRVGDVLRSVDLDWLDHAVFDEFADEEILACDVLGLCVVDRIVRQVDRSRIVHVQDGGLRRWMPDLSQDAANTDPVASSKGACDNLRLVRARCDGLLLLRHPRDRSVSKHVDVAGRRVCERKSRIGRPLDHGARRPVEARLLLVGL